MFALAVSYCEHIQIYSIVFVSCIAKTALFEQLKNKQINWSHNLVQTGLIYFWQNLAKPSVANELDAVKRVFFIVFQYGLVSEDVL